MGVDGVKTMASTPPQLNEVPVHPILTPPGEIKKVEREDPRDHVTNATMYAERWRIFK